MCSLIQIVDPLARGRAFRMVEEVDGYSVPQTPLTPGAASLCSFTSSRSGLNRLPRRRKRESVAKMSFRAAAALVKGRSIRESTLRQAQRRSFTPASFMEEDIADFPDELDTSFFTRVRQKTSVTTLEQPVNPSGGEHAGTDGPEWDLNPEPPCYDCANVTLAGFLPVFSIPGYSHARRAVHVRG